MAAERPQVYVVRTERGSPYDFSRRLREQDGWDDHATFMDALVDDGFVRIGGPLEGDRQALLVIDAPSEEALRDRLGRRPVGEERDVEREERRALDDPARRLERVTLRGPGARAAMIGRP